MGIGKKSILLDNFGKAVERGIRLDQLIIKTVGVDATIWLVTVHRNLEDNQKKNYSLHAKRFMDYCGERIDVLQRNGLIPIIVFDGNATPLKTEMYASRKKLRKAIKDDNNKKKNGQEIRDADSDSDINDSDNNNDSDQHVENELEHFIKPKHRYIPDRSKVLKWLTDERKVDFIVAPYEADAQLAYLANNGIVDAVITEDSDLIAFGCPNIIYNMSVEEQTCDYYSFSRLKEKNDAYKKFTPKMLLEMCIMIGCDYLPNMKGIGISKAREEITKWGNYYDAIILTERKMELRTGLGPKDLKTEKREIIPIFEKAIMAFTYQLVYNPMSETCERLSHMSYETTHMTLVGEENAAFLGPRLKHKSVRDIAKGYRSSEIKITDVDYWEKQVEKKRKIGQMFIDKMFPRKTIKNKKIEE